MTNKIIIDGVDVIDCKHYQYKKPEDYEMRYPNSGDCYIGLCAYLFNCQGLIDDFEKHCIDNPNCYYKQLKRKEQECEKLKVKLNPKLKNVHCVYFEGQTGQCRAKEFTRCNPINCKLYTIDELSTIVDLQNRNTKLKKECEELKTQLKQVKYLYEVQDEKLIDELATENKQYKQVLDEIEEFCLVYRENPIEGTAYNKILDIINKAREE